MQIISLVLFFFIGIISIICFHIGYYFSISISVLLILLTTIFILRSYKKNKIGLLICIIYLVFILPFIHIPPYIWFDFSSRPYFMWGLVANPYMVDEKIIKLTAMLGAVGSIGIALGVAFASQKNKHIIEKTNLNHPNTMGLAIWLTWVSIGLLLSWLNAPTDSIFTSNYTDSKAPIDGGNFASSWMMSYVIITFAFCDTIFEKNNKLKKIKQKISIMILIYIVIFLQLLRGDRESLPWVFGLFLLYYVWGVKYTQKPGFQIPWHKVGLFTFIIFFFSIIVAVLRSSVAGFDIIQLVSLLIEYNKEGVLDLSNFLNGTWSGVLMTPLSVAGDFINNNLTLKLGKDYLNLFLSIPPGFIADLFGYVRPIDSSAGPAWEMTYGLGGTHAVVVPFMNFRMTGVLLIPAIWTSALIFYEKQTLKKTNVINLAFLVTIVMCSPHWLWYGEKAGLNAFILWFILKYFYKISLSIFPSTTNE